MPDDLGHVKQWNCPWCFARQNDSAGLLYDRKKGEYYCVKCCFTGDSAKIVEEYGYYQKRYRLMKTRLKILDGME